MNQPQSPTLALALKGFFLDYLPQQRALSPLTLQSYRDSLKLLLRFVTGGDPSRLAVEDLRVEKVTAFLQSLETNRKNRVSTRNVRLSAIHSFFRYLGGQHPEHLQQAQRILSIPFKRTASREIQHLDFDEIQAVLKAVERGDGDGNGRRDRALLGLMFNTGARVSEIVGLQTADLRLTAPCSILFRGKGRKERTCPIWPETAGLLQKLLEQQNSIPSPTAPVFLNDRGARLTRFGIRLILNKYVAKAASQQPSLKRKRLHPHSIRHSTALHLLRSGVDLSTIAHWLGHVSVNTTNKYLCLDLEAKREALAKAKPLLKRGRHSGKWRRDPDLMAWLTAL